MSKSLHAVVRLALHASRCTLHLTPATSRRHLISTYHNKPMSHQQASTIMEVPILPILRLIWTECESTIWTDMGLTR
jgi:hypothetical protein